MTGGRRRDCAFALGCAIFYALVVALVPPYTPLTEPDSAGYIEFSPLRPAYYPAFLAVRRPRSSATWLTIAAVVLPPLIGAGGERALYFAVHRTQAISQAANLLFAKAAMLIGPDTRFGGPQAAAFAALGQELHADYAPLQRVVAQQCRRSSAPSTKASRSTASSILRSSARRVKAACRARPFVRNSPGRSSCRIPAAICA
jgi:hypothetical protein